MKCKYGTLVNENEKIGYFSYFASQHAPLDKLGGWSPLQKK